MASTISAEQVSERLAARAEEVAAMLLPAGKRQGREWVAGSVDGEAGRSLSVCVSGEKAGTWADFAGDGKGDLLDLWAAVRGMDLSQAMKDAAGWLGMSMPRVEPPAKQYAAVRRGDDLGEPDLVLSWLKGRGINESTITAFRVREKSDLRDTWAVFPYIRLGKVVNRKYRALGQKDHRQEKDAMPCLFGWHLIPDSARSIVICEGEVDAMTLHQCGIPALSVNAGAGNVPCLENDLELLARFDRIVLAYDDDESGHEGAQKAIKVLGRRRCFVVPGYGGAKDSNEALTRLGEAAVRRAIESAQKPANPNITMPSAQTVAAMLWPAPGTPRPPQLMVGDGRIDMEMRTSEVTIWTGRSGHGKTTMLAQACLQLAEQGMRSVIYSGEVRDALMAKKMVKQLTAQDRAPPPFILAAMEQLAQRVAFTRCGISVETDELLDIFRDMVDEGYSHFVIDNLMTLSDVEVDGQRALSSQKNAVLKIKGFAESAGVHVSLVAHPRKGQHDFEAADMTAVSGSAAITNLADNVLSVARLKKDLDNPDDGAPDHDGLLNLLKQREGSVQWKTYLLWFDRESQRFRSSRSEKLKPMFEYSGPAFHYHAGHISGDDDGQ